MNQSLVFGSECLPAIRKLIDENQWSRILLVTGKKSFELSRAQKFINDCFSGYDLTYFRFSEFDNNPHITDLKRGLELTKDFRPSVIIAIGGGSVIDMGKLIRFFHTHKGEILSKEYEQNGIEIPIIAIPTTAGTGSEATHFAVLYDENNIKHSIADKGILPDYAVVNPELTYAQTPYLTACAGFDALAQAIEAYWNKNATKESDEYAVKAIDLMYQTLPEVVKNPTPELRAKMAEGAYWAGKAIDITKTTAPHAFSYPFTAHYGIPHGHAVAITFPTIAELNIHLGVLQGYKKIYLSTLIGGNNIKESLKTFIQQIDLDLIPNQFDIELLLSEINIERLSNNPVSLDPVVCNRILTEIKSQNATRYNNPTITQPI